MNLPNYAKQFLDGNLNFKQESKLNYPLRNDNLDSIYTKIAILSEMQMELIDEANDIQKRLNPKIEPTETLKKYRASLVYFSESMLTILNMDKKISGSTVYQTLFKAIEYHVNKNLKYFRNGK